MRTTCKALCSSSGCSDKQYCTCFKINCKCYFLEPIFLNVSKAKILGTSWPLWTPLRTHFNPKLNRKCTGHKNLRLTILVVIFQRHLYLVFYLLLWFSTNILTIFYYLRFDCLFYFRILLVTFLCGNALATKVYHCNSGWVFLSPINTVWRAWVRDYFTEVHP